MSPTLQNLQQVTPDVNQFDQTLPDLELPPGCGTDFLGPYRQQIHPDDVDSLVALVEVADVPDAHAIVRVRDKHGSWRLVEHRPSHSAGATTRISRVDVTEREHSRGRAEVTEGYWRAVLRNGHESIVVLDPQTLRIRFVSDHLLSLLETDDSTVLGSNGLTFVDSRDHAQLRDALEQLAGPDHGREQVEARLLIPGGEPVWMEAVFSDARDDPYVNAIVVNLRDITDRKNAEERLRSSEHLFRVLLLQLADGALVIDKAENITFVSERAAEAIGLRVDQLLGRPLPLSETPTGLHLGMDPVDASSSSLSRLPADAFNRAGRCFELAAHDLRSDPVVEGTVVVLRDITERRRRDERLRREAEIDSLTGLLNRRGFEAAVRDHLLNDAELAVAYIDLDGFKQINDQMGHAVGDSLLQGIARRIQAAVRPGDELARFGGDEFVIAFVDPGSDPADLIGRLILSIERPHHVGELVLRPGASAGWSRVDPNEGIAPALERADQAMYRDKRARR